MQGKPLHVALSASWVPIMQYTQDQKMSGRSLRRLPVLAHARYISLGYTFSALTATDSAHKAVNGSGTPNAPGPSGLGTPVEVWLNAIESVVEGQGGELKRFEQ
jgi:pachytene checkpoint protein 2